MGQWHEIKEKSDFNVLILSGLLCLGFVAFVAAFPAKTAAVFDQCLSFFTVNFGWLYSLVVILFIVILFWLFFSKYGKIVLGKDDDQPEYSTLSWLFMLFAAGMGIGIVFWSVAEPMSHYLWPPYGEGSTIESAKLAMQYSFLHWGIHPWAIYGIIGLILAYFQYRKGKPALLSSCFIPLIGETRANGRWGSAINTFSVIITVFGVAASLGFGVIQINSGLNYVFGIPNTNGVKIFLIIVTTTLFIISSVSGIDRGVKILSDTNMAIAGILMLFVFILGPSLFIVNYFVDSLGAYLTSIISTSFWTDSFQSTNGWLSGWTIFYWAWWLSWGPFVGGFIARISKGRTIRTFVAGTLFCPVILSFLFFSIMGGTAINLDLGGNTAIAEAMGQDISYALFAMLYQLPFPLLTSVISMVLISIFFITSADSSTFVCAMMTSRGVQNPPLLLRGFWGVAEAGVAIVLLMAGGLSALKTISIIVAFPFMLMCVFMIIAFFKALRDDPVIGGKHA